MMKCGLIENWILNECIYLNDNKVPECFLNIWRKTLRSRTQNPLTTLTYVPPRRNVPDSYVFANFSLLLQIT
jgi:hypothetical protein